MSTSHALLTPLQEDRLFPGPVVTYYHGVRSFPRSLKQMHIRGHCPEEVVWLLLGLLLGLKGLAWANLNSPPSWVQSH